MKDNPTVFQYSRRQILLQSAVAGCCGLAMQPAGMAQDQVQTPSSERVYGMLIGSFIGDAAGGPVEFAEPQSVQDVLPNARNWDAARRLNDRELQSLSAQFPMLSYESLRPDAAAYGPWKSNAPAGTITDDSRMKIILMRALTANGRLTRERIAEEMIRFQPKPDEQPNPNLQALINEGLAEYRLAANWLLGERDESKALPIERLWAGIANCSGQMLLLPVAAQYPGDPEAAYRATWELDFVDAPLARDFCAALNAGLAAALAPQLDTQSVEARWTALLTAMSKTDPFRLREVPFAGRPLDKWLHMARKIAVDAKGSPAVLYRTLEEYGQPVYWWDAHFTLLTPLAILQLCRFNPMAAMHLCLDFGHDTDSYAQVLGAMVGAVHGPTVFPNDMRQTVLATVLADYGEDLQDWPAQLIGSRTNA